MTQLTKENRSKGLRMRVLSWGIIVAAAAFTVYVYFSNPFEGGVTLCVFHALTGLDCPGCGMTRAAWLLMHGHPIQSLAQNPFLFVIFVAAYMGVAELSPHLIVRQLPQLRIPNWVLIVLSVALFVFTIARNVVKFL